MILLLGFISIRLAEVPGSTPGLARYFCEFDQFVNVLIGCEFFEVSSFVVSRFGKRGQSWQFGTTEGKVLLPQLILPHLSRPSQPRP